MAKEGNKQVNFVLFCRNLNVVLIKKRDFFVAVGVCNPSQTVSTAEKPGDTIHCRVFPHQWH